MNMKKIFALTLAVLMIFSLAACAKKEKKDDGVKVMSYAEYDAAAMDAEVVIECYVQAHQSWWDNKITVYAQDEDGAYFIYEMACSEEDAAKLTKGTKIRVTGVKGAWAGEVEVMDATFEIIEGNWIAEPMDATALLGTEDLTQTVAKAEALNGKLIDMLAAVQKQPTANTGGLKLAKKG